MAWHSAETYRTGDGRGGGGRGQQRFAPLNSWPDNVSLDKARRLLWPIKQKYGRKILGPEPEAEGLDAQGLGWKNGFGTGKGADTITSGLEVTWTTTPTRWGTGFFQHLFGHEWGLTKSPGGAYQWVAKGAAATVPDAHDRTKKHRPTMLTTDLSLRIDPSYERISRRFMEHPEEFAEHHGK